MTFMVQNESRDSKSLTISCVNLCVDLNTTVFRYHLLRDWHALMNRYSLLDDRVVFQAACRKPIKADSELQHRGYVLRHA